MSKLIKLYTLMCEDIVSQSYLNKAVKKTQKAAT